MDSQKVTSVSYNKFRYKKNAFFFVYINYELHLKRNLHCFLWYLNEWSSLLSTRSSSIRIL